MQISLELCFFVASFLLFSLRCLPLSFALHKDFLIIYVISLERTIPRRLSAIAVARPVNNLTCDNKYRCERLLWAITNKHRPNKKSDRERGGESKIAKRRQTYSPCARYIETVANKQIYRENAAGGEEGARENASREAILLAIPHGISACGKREIARVGKILKN